MGHLGLNDMGQEEKLDSDMGQEEKIDSDIGHESFLKIDMATLSFLNIDMAYGDPHPIKGPLSDSLFTRLALRLVGPYTRERGGRELVPRILFIGDWCVLRINQRVSNKRSALCWVQSVQRTLHRLDWFYIWDMR